MIEISSHDYLWRRIFTERVPEVHAERWILARLPSEPRCSWCNAPFGGIGGTVLRRVFHRYRSNFNPRLCNVCDEYIRDHPGGAEVELTLLFADVRSSTRLAEQMSATEFSRLMDRFYTVATEAVSEHDGLIEKFVGDEIVVYLSLALRGRITRKRRSMQHRRSWPRRDMPVRRGHGCRLAQEYTQASYVGSVGSGGVAQLTVLGDLPNAAARLASVAGPGEILVSEASCRAATLDVGADDRRKLLLKGRSELLTVAVLNAGAPRLST